MYLSGDHFHLCSLSSPINCSRPL